MPRHTAAEGARGFHILDVMASMNESMQTREAVKIMNSVHPVPMLPEGWEPYEQTIC